MELQNLKALKESLKIKELKILCTGELEVDYRGLLELQLLEDGRNLKQTDDEKILKLAESLLRFGIVNNIQVWFDDAEKCFCFDAHHRKKALAILTEIGVVIPKLPATRCLAETKTEAKKLLLIKESRSSWVDVSVVPDYMKEIGFDFKVAESIIDLPEFSWSDIAVDEAQKDADNLKDNQIPEVPAERVFIKSGDLLELGKHRVLCGDSTLAKNVKKLMCKNKAELLFTSPPYSDLRDYGGNKNLSVDNIVKFIPTFYSFVNYQIINLGIKRQDYEIIEYWQEYILKAKESGYKFLSWNIWNRNDSGTLANQTAMFAISHEWLFVFGKRYKALNKTRKNKNPGGKTGLIIRQEDGILKKTTGKGIVAKKSQLRTVFDCYPVKSNKIDHPAVFPVEMPENYIKAMTIKNEIVCDPFLGSGSTLIAADKTGRRCFGMEIDPYYCQITAQRWLDFTENDQLKINGQKVIWSELSEA